MLIGIWRLPGRHFRQHAAILDRHHFYEFARPEHPVVEYGLRPFAAGIPGMARDEALLKRLIASHAGYTGSERAQTILANWVLWSRKFVKVMPIEYRRALAEMAAKKAPDINRQRAA